MGFSKNYPNSLRKFANVQVELIEKLEEGHYLANLTCHRRRSKVLFAPFEDREEPLKEYLVKKGVAIPLRN